MPTVQPLEDQNYTSLEGYAYWCVHCIQLEASSLNCIVVFNEVVFHVDVKVNTLDVRGGEAENSHEQWMVATDCKQVIVCCALSVNRVVRRY